MKPIEYINRKTGSLVTEKVPGEFWLRWLYTSFPGKLALETVVKRKALSSLAGKMMDRPSSRKKIHSFIEEYGISMDESLKSPEEFTSFNDFFYRELKEGSRTPQGDENTVVSPADGKILIYENISADESYLVKGMEFTLEEYLGDTTLAEEFTGGTMLLIRLCPADYHRFHFPVSGTPDTSVFIPGSYYSVSPIALRENTRIFCENKRERTLIHSDLFDKVLYLEIGATMVGSILQTFTPGQHVNRCDEKGYFKFGGSSVMLLFKKDMITVDSDLLLNSQKGYETTVEMGEKIAVKSS